MNAQLKTVIDRSVMKWTKIKDKDFYLITTAAENNDHVMNGTVKSFQGFLECLTDAREAGYILSKGVYNKGEIIGKPIIKEAYETGKSIY